MKKKNYTDLVYGKASGTHCERIIKYFDRTGITTSIQCPPLLSYYHNHINEYNSNSFISLNLYTNDFIKEPNFRGSFLKYELKIPHLDIKDYIPQDICYFFKKKVIGHYSYYHDAIKGKYNLDDLKEEDFKEQEHKYFSECYGIEIKEKYIYVKPLITKKLIMSLGYLKKVVVI